ncbi:MAG: nuclear envelope integral membrane protein [Prosthecobacter sp.]|nr:nuclear envelope integral membrane protein [Prosthecobacter sp.]
MNEERTWLQHRAQDVVNAPRLLVTFVAIGAFLVYFQPIGWTSWWLFGCLGFGPGILAVNSILSQSQAHYRMAIALRILVIIVSCLVMWRLVPVSALGAMLWGFAFVIPQKLLLVAFRRSLLKFINGKLYPGLSSDNDSSQR